MSKFFEVEFMLERETKGAVRYAELTDSGDVAAFEECVIGTLYIRKRALNGDAIPQRLTVTITEAE